MSTNVSTPKVFSSNEKSTFQLGITYGNMAFDQLVLKINQPVPKLITLDYQNVKVCAK